MIWAILYKLNDDGAVRFQMCTWYALMTVPNDAL